ncbi:MAG: type II toxin-antitoxin system VapC family toxin [Gemmatimonas sp.]
MIASARDTALVALDASIFIYFLEKHPQWGPIARRYFVAHHSNQLQLVTSSLTFLEVTVKPLRENESEIVRQYEEMLSDAFGIRVVDIDREQLRMAARLRAQYGLKTPDALQISAALTSSCSLFITNDKPIPAIPGLEIVQLSDLQ